MSGQIYKDFLYSAFWPNTALRTTRLSATSGPRTLLSILASTNGGAGSFSRVFKFYQRTENKDAQDFFFTYLGGNTGRVGDTQNFFREFRPYRNTRYGTI